MKANLYGIKLGSERTVVYGKGVAPKSKVIPNTWGPRHELTCVQRVPTHLLRPDFNYRFSYEAEHYKETIYPLEYGLPRDDDLVPLSKAVLLTKEYVDWLLRDGDEDTGIVFCLPMMQQKEGLEHLKAILNRLSKGTIGKKFIGEAWAAALATVGIEDTLSTHLISMNFGSSTLEVALYSGKELVAQNVYPHGGWDLDRDLASAISQAHRGITVTARHTRIVKEKFAYNPDPEKVDPVEGEFLKGGKVVETLVEAATINPVIEKFCEDIAEEMAAKFLPTAARASEVAVSSLQTEGIGKLCVCGGLSDMPGFAKLMGDTLIKHKAMSPQIDVVSPKDPDGVSAPAWGAYMMAELFEERRISKKQDTW